MRRFLDETRIFDSTRVLHYISEISQFHRIQGSKELVEAARFLREELAIWGIKAALYEDVYDGVEWYLTLQSPVAWNLIRAELKFDGKELHSWETPLVSLAHSPSGSFEGDVLPILREDDWKLAEGKAVLVGKSWREAYKKANEAGAAALIAYREGTGNAVPYIGLFLTREDMKWAGIPAFAVPEAWAKGAISKALSGEKVWASGSIEAEVGEHEVLPVLYAEVGEAPFVLFTAHLCHPKPGANDNASGSAMLVELARIMNTVYKDSFRFGFAFLWVPEYYGTQAFLERHADLSKYYAVVNLDMVAGSGDRAGSTVMLVRTPLSRFSMVSGLLEYFLGRANAGERSFSGSPLPKLRLKSYPYEMGSDHDVFNFFGIPAIMPITWPDRFYHSSEDTVDKVSKDSIEVIGRAITATALALAGAEVDELRSFARAYVMKYLGELGMEGSTEVAEKLVMWGLARDSKFLGIKSGHEFDRRPWLSWTVRGIINEDVIERTKPALVKKFKELTKDRKVLVHLHELLMLGELLPKEEAFKALEEEYGEVNEEGIEGLIDLLSEAGIISFVRSD
ncbi:DUF4910 domain-containing protein [Thermococcus sp.]|uniref:DUF4910 domain-containing protein n=1 Tax=Thermococcus sp. TaxID=35749 RepID=UPI0025FCA173|nr:DUF4910 domain-containing protein [Thermococcus sp.]